MVVHNWDRRPGRSRSLLVIPSNKHSPAIHPTTSLFTDWVMQAPLGSRVIVTFINIDKDENHKRFCTFAWVHFLTGKTVTLWMPVCKDYYKMEPLTHMHDLAHSGRSQHVHIWGKSTMNQQNDIQNSGYQQPVLEFGHNDTPDN